MYRALSLGRTKRWVGEKSRDDSNKVHFDLVLVIYEGSNLLTATPKISFLLWSDNITLDCIGGFVLSEIHGYAQTVLSIPIFMPICNVSVFLI